MLIATAGSLRAQGSVDEALARATQYLVATQDPQTGGIHNKMRHETAMTSLSLLALASCGHQPSDPTPEGAAKLSVNGALTLYLDFINMFQFLLQLLGDRR